MMIRYNDTSNVANDDDYDDNSIDSIAFAVFGFSKFRLGTQQTRFQIADLLIHGRLPLGRIMISICPLMMIIVIMMMMIVIMMMIIGMMM
jgi:hypothetical protein